MNSSLSFLIPTYNDEESIETVIRNADSVGKALSKKYEIVVLNDASTDKTPDILKKLATQIPPLRILNHEKNGGYGKTVRDLYYVGTNELLFSLPGDNQIDAMELNKLLPYISSADIIIGRRINRNDTFSRKIQSLTYNLLLRTFFHVPTFDVNSVRLMKKKMLKSINLTSSSPFVDAELVIRAIRSGFRVVEVSIHHKSRTTEGATGGSLTRTILPTVRDLLKFLFIRT